MDQVQCKMVDAVWTVWMDHVQCKMVDAVAIGRCRSITCVVNSRCSWMVWMYHVQCKMVDGVGRCGLITCDWTVEMRDSWVDLIISFSATVVDPGQEAWATKLTRV